jgi:hypothetical protein
LLNSLAQFTKDFFRRMNTACIGVGKPPFDRGVKFGQTSGLLLFGALKRFQASADHVEIRLIVARFQSPPDGSLQIGRQIDCMRLILCHRGHSLLPET